MPLDKAAGDEDAHKTAGICEHTPAQEQVVRVLPLLLTHAAVRTLTYDDVPPKYAHTHTHAHVCMRIHTHVCMRIHTHVCMRIHTHVCMRIHTHMECSFHASSSRLSPFSNRKTFVAFNYVSGSTYFMAAAVRLSINMFRCVEATGYM